MDAWKKLYAAARRAYFAAESRSDWEAANAAADRCNALLVQCLGCARFPRTEAEAIVLCQ